MPAVGKFTMTQPPSAQRFMPMVRGGFLRAFPTIDIVFYYGTAETISRRVAQGEVELGVSSVFPSAAELAFRPLLTDTIGAVCHATRPLADSNALRWTDLAGH